MRLLHTSDWHLGMMRSQTATYREDQQAFIDGICGVIARERVDAVLLSGDVYDTGVSRAEALGMFDAACRAICGELGCRLIVIAGNHDSGSRLAQHSALLARSFRWRRTSRSGRCPTSSARRPPRSSPTGKSPNPRRPRCGR